MKDEELMLRVACDVHEWMTGFVGVVSYPYFAASGAAGTYTIEDVPPGTYTICTWPERYGELSLTVKLTASATSTANQR